jgi:16S rRNA processing protein RimM
MPGTDELITVGKIIGTHGIKGMVKLYSYSGNLESLQKSDTVTLKSPAGQLKEMHLEAATHHGGKFILHFRDYGHIDQALSLVGSEICLLRSQLPKPDEDEYYWCDLLGLEVVTINGDSIGAIADIFETGSSDIYVVRGNGKEYLIPAIASVITSVDVASGKMVITPLEGLLDL